MTSRERAKLHSLKSAWHADPVRIARKVNRALAGLPPESQRVIVSAFVAHVDQLLLRIAARRGVEVRVYDSLETLRRLAHGEEIEP